MSLGTLYADTSCRTTSAKGLIKYYNLDIAIKGREGDFAKLFPLQKIPGFVGPKGLKLTEAIAINYYILSLIPEQKLTGKTKLEEIQILRWLSLGNSDLLGNIAAGFAGVVGRIPYNKKTTDAGVENALKIIDTYFEPRLKEFTYLVGERITIADLFVAGLCVRGFQYLWGSEFIKAHPGFVRWWKTVTAHPIIAPFFTDFKFIEEPLKYTPPKKEKKKAEPKEEAPKKKEAAAEPAAEAAPAPKPKHPLEALGKAKMALDDWKRTYSNEETREVALPWFWEHYDASEWSLYKVSYKYNDELTLTFMSNNLVGGFFNRLSASTKYLFGCMVVYGENNNNGIVGAFLVRGQDYEPAFNVAPDWESYEYKKLDASNPEDKALVEDLWAWDKPISINGEQKEIADGKVFK